MPRMTREEAQAEAEKHTAESDKLYAAATHEPSHGVSVMMVRIAGDLATVACQYRVLAKILPATPPPSKP